MRYVIGAVLVVAVTAQVWLPYMDCTAYGNYWTRCILRVEQIR